MNQQLFTEPCLATALRNIPKTRQVNPLDRVWHVTEKLDGYYIQIVRIATEVYMFSRSGKELFIPAIADKVLTDSLYSGNFAIECEYLYGCQGLLGDRVKCAMMSKYIKAFKEGGKEACIEVSSTYSKHKVVLFNTLSGTSVGLDKVKPLGIMSLEEALNLPIENGLEGYVLQHIYFKYKIGRSNHKIKIKSNPSVKGVVIGYNIGVEGSEFDGLVGSLRIKLESGELISVGSGLKLNQRELADMDHLLGKIALVSFDYKTVDGKYSQPTIREILSDQKELDL